jgi:hypothetical protein
MIDYFRLSNLPGYAKVFVALFTSLMLCVCLWAAWLYTVEKGGIDENNLPAYLQSETQSSADVEKHEHGEEHGDLRHNLGLAHTHINGQTLLFFAMGLVFLFTSAKPKIKKTVFWSLGLSVLTHVIGLSGEGYHWIFDDLLTLSGVVMLITIVYMALLIFVDLARNVAAMKGKA